MRYASVEEYANAKAEFALVWLVYGAGAVAVLALVAKPSLLAFAVLGTLFALVAWTAAGAPARPLPPDRAAESHRCRRPLDRASPARWSPSTSLS